LIWFAVRDGHYSLTDEERADVLILLQEEVKAACICQNEVLCLQDDQKPSCDDICREPAERVVGYIKTMKAVEGEIVEHKTNKTSKVTR
jgi:hypothetical protein